MISTVPNYYSEAVFNKPAKFRRAAIGNDSSILESIYQEETNIAIWQRQLTEKLQDNVSVFLETHPNFDTNIIVTPQNAHSKVSELFGTSELAELSEDITQLVTLFCNLFELNKANLSFKTLDQAMCPKFHSDSVPCRLLTTYSGCATEWLPHHLVNRSKLGIRSNGLPDAESGLFQNPVDIQRLNCGEVALLKGELWQGNADAGLVHRSPTLSNGENRLLLRLDYF